MQIEKEIRDFLKHYDIRLVMSHSTFNIGMVNYFHTNIANLCYTL